ncbi:MAG: hypothetical protein WCT48_04775 [Candidatus Paceibacterota bacterium]|jgi:hypothetical protein
MKNQKSKRNKIIAVGVAILAIIGLFSWKWYFGVANAQDFVRAYQAYDVVSREHEISAYTPGTEKNTARQGLNAILSQVLNESVSPEERLSFAEAGLVPLAKIRSEIDIMKEKGREAEKNVIILREKKDNLGGRRIFVKANDMIVLAEERIAIIREIETVSYRMNDTVSDIFKGIIKDKGELTGGRIQSLNEKIPDAEKDFERLSELYRNLEKTDKKMDDTFARFQNFAG